MTNLSAQQAAMSVLNVEGDERLIENIALAEKRGAAWFWDPEFSQVAGLGMDPESRDAMIIVYITDSDFEYDEMRMLDFIRD